MPENIKTAATFLKVKGLKSRVKSQAYKTSFGCLIFIFDFHFNPLS